MNPVGEKNKPQLSIDRAAFLILRVRRVFKGKLSSSKNSAAGVGAGKHPTQQVERPSRSGITFSLFSSKAVRHPFQKVFLDIPPTIRRGSVERQLPPLISRVTGNHPANYNPPDTFHSRRPHFFRPDDKGFVFGGPRTFGRLLTIFSTSSSSTAVFCCQNTAVARKTTTRPFRLPLTFN